MIVVDTNVIAYLHINGSRTARAETRFQQDPEWAAPILWRSEFSNILIRYMKYKYLTLTQAAQVFETAELLMKERTFQVKAPLVLELASQSGCPAYDCEFVALAIDLGINLITTNKRVLKQFPDVAIQL